MKKLFALTVIAALLVLCGCVVTPPPQSINNDPLVEVVAIDEVGLFAADRDGHKVAVAKSGLTLLSLDSKSEQKLSSDQPIAFSWQASPTPFWSESSCPGFECAVQLSSSAHRPPPIPW